MGTKYPCSFPSNIGIYRKNVKIFMLSFAENFSDYALQVETKRFNSWRWNEEQKEFYFLSDNVWKRGMFCLWQRLIGDKKTLRFEGRYPSAERKELLRYFVPERVWMMTKQCYVCSTVSEQWLANFNLRLTKSVRWIDSGRRSRLLFWGDLKVVFWREQSLNDDWKALFLPQALRSFSEKSQFCC